MKKNYLFFVVLILMGAFLAAGCENLKTTNSHNPTTITLWHNYGGQLKETTDEMIDEFNETVGKKEGIIINVTSISGSAAIHEKLTMAANGEPAHLHYPTLQLSTLKLH